METKGSLIHAYSTGTITASAAVTLTDYHTETYASLPANTIPRYAFFSKVGTTNLTADTFMIAIAAVNLSAAVNTAHINAHKAVYVPFSHTFVTSTSAANVTLRSAGSNITAGQVDVRLIYDIAPVKSGTIVYQE